MLKLHNLTYGKTVIKVMPSFCLPLPQEFDFDDPIGCARKCLAIMSNAAGGHPLHDCKVRLHQPSKSANITSSGAHLYYGEDHPKIGVEEAMKRHDESEVLMLGTVNTDQYGDGWKRAAWIPHKD